MGYTSKRGRRPSEYASKSAHSHIIQDDTVQDFLLQCRLPTTSGEVEIDDEQRVLYVPVEPNPIKHVIAVDGGYTEVAVRSEFPSATICFFQFGALFFSVEDLEKLEDVPFIDPADMSKLKKIERFKFTIPVRNVTLHDQNTLTHSIRKALYDFFMRDLEGDTLMASLRWLVFEEFGGGIDQWVLASCPVCSVGSIPLLRKEMAPAFVFTCPHCNGQVFLTDVFRIHEAVDDELGAGGVLGYVTTTIEQLLLVHLIRLILNTKAALLKHILFVKDGPLAFFGQTANMHQPMRSLVSFLFSKHALYLAGLEKSGPFVEHADEIADLLNKGTILILTNDYIYKYVIPGKADPKNPYGRSTYYGNKLIFKTRGGGVYVVTLPTEKVNASPKIADFPNVMATLTNIEKLRCDMYDSALVPVALVNKLVSLADHPSSRILQKFAIGAITQ